VFPQRAVFGALIGVSLPVAIKGGFASAAGLIAFGFLASRLPRFRSLAMPDSCCAQAGNLPLDSYDVVMC
jgi:hypothetical protein